MYALDINLKNLPMMYDPRPAVRIRLSPNRKARLNPFGAVPADGAFLPPSLP